MSAATCLPARQQAADVLDSRTEKDVLHGQPYAGRSSCDSSECTACHQWFPQEPCASAPPCPPPQPQASRLSGSLQQPAKRQCLSLDSQADDLPARPLRRDRQSSTALDVMQRSGSASQRDSLDQLVSGLSEDATSSSSVEDSCFDEAADVPLCDSAAQPYQPAWAPHSPPAPAVLTEEFAFERPGAPLRLRQRNADIVCAVEFSPDGMLLATAGVAKQVRVYSLAGAFAGGVGGLQRAPVVVHRLPSKLSSLAWSPDSEGVVTVGDYDGEVSQVHLASGHYLGDADGHSGRRVWSVAHSPLRRHLCVSASDDGTARLWAGLGLAASAGVISIPGGAPVCGAEFSPWDDHLLALASADRCAYVYDLRRADAPLATLGEHARAVSYVRWLGRRQLATACTDSVITTWALGSSLAGSNSSLEGSSAVGAPAGSELGCSELGCSCGAVAPGSSASAATVAHWGSSADSPRCGGSVMASAAGWPTAGAKRKACACASVADDTLPDDWTCAGSAAAAAIPGACAPSAAAAAPRLLQQLRGHRNCKNFVGLSVRPEEGLLACGSETPAAFVYHAACAAPLASAPLARRRMVAGAADQGCAPREDDGLQVDAFVSAVCWQPSGCAGARAAGVVGGPLLAAVLSDGALRVLRLRPA